MTSVPQEPALHNGGDRRWETPTEARLVLGRLDATLVLRFIGPFDTATVTRFARTLTAAVDGSTQAVTVDLSDVTAIDEATFEMIERLCHGADGLVSVGFHGASGDLRRALHPSSLD